VEVMKRKKMKMEMEMKNYCYDEELQRRWVRRRRRGGRENKYVTE